MFPVKSLIITVIVLSTLCNKLRRDKINESFITKGKTIDGYKIQHNYINLISVY